jgi:hypothetical protein
MQTRGGVDDDNALLHMQEGGRPFSFLLVENKFGHLGRCSRKKLMRYVNLPFSFF